MSFLINPFMLAAAGGASAVYSHHVDAGPYTTTNSTSGTAATALSATIVAADQQASTDYLILWSAEVNNDANGSSLVELRVGGSVVRTQEVNGRDTAPQEWYPCGGIARMQSGASPVDTALAITFYRGTTGTAGVRNAKITRLKLGASDQYAEQTTAQTNSTTSYTTALSLGFTPGSAGDYLIVYSMSFGGASSAVRADFRVGDGTTTIASGYLPEHAAERIPVVIGQRFNAMSGAKTFSIEIKTGTAGTNAIADDITIVAIRLDRFSDAQTAALGADNSGTEDSYTTGHSQTFTPNAGDYLTLGLFGYEGGSSAVSAYAQLDDGGTVLGETVHEPRIGTSNQGWMGGLMQTVATYAASSRTQAIQRKSETAGTAVRIKNGAMIAALRLTGLS